MKYTASQQNVIDIRDCNLLVSAAAGSGKTAVLVQRIMQKITDLNKPLDIDRILLMTFTKASAAEMKQRLQKCLNTAYAEAVQSGNERLIRHLRRQMSLIRGAYISTIDGFCTSVLRNHFAQADIDPAFRVGDSGELCLIKEEVLEKVLEAQYENPSEDFIALIEAYGGKRDDRKVADVILKLYEYSQSKPFPEIWLSECVSRYNYETKEELFSDKFIVEYIKTLNYGLKTALSMARRYEQISLLPAGPYMNSAVFEKEREEIEKLAAFAENNADYDEMRDRLRNFKFGRLSSKKDDSVDLELKEAARNLHDKCKDKIKKIAEKYKYTSEQLFQDVSRVKPYANELVRLTLLFAAQFADAKRDEKLVDFSDLEHKTIQVFTKQEDGGEQLVPTSAALAYRELFEEIYIDEYQDSNSVQETIIKAICRNEKGRKNLFMVGDVKQSIYKFRMAEPGMFVDKSDNYTLLKELRNPVPEEVRIDLDRNFRSRSSVLDCVNFFFDKIMCREVGGVEYDEAARLKYGASYIENNGEQSVAGDMWQAELNLILNDKNITADKKELEAIGVVNRIRELMKNQLIQDGDSLRKLKYGDIAILLRSMSGWESVFKRVFAQYNIPLYTESKTGYFDSYEVTSILNMLSVINNPRDDETLCAVLLGYFGGMTEPELAQIRIYNKKSSFYEAAMRYAGIWKSIENTPKKDNSFSTEGAAVSNAGVERAEDARDENIVVKLKRFFEFYNKYREKSAYLTVKELIDEFVSESGFEIALSVRTNGEQRLLNLEMLKEKAGAYEKISYQGIYNFMKYINQLRQYQVEQGQAEVVAADAVQLITIHKSKGLEFPVCFVSGMHKQFNNSDSRSDLLMDAEGGIGIRYVDLQQRVKSDTLLMNAISKRTEMESLGEELRVLYVAMTRAREKLIITGVTDEKELTDVFKNTCDFTDGGKLVPEEVCDAKKMLDWLFKAVSGEDSIKELFGCYAEEKISDDILNGDIEIKTKHALIKDAGLKVSIIDPRAFVLAQVDNKITQDTLRKDYEKRRYNAEITDTDNKYNELFGWRYPFADENGKNIYVPLKASVSKLKHEAMEELDLVRLAEDEVKIDEYENKSTNNEIADMAKNNASFNNNDNNNGCKYNLEKSDEPVPQFIKVDRGELEKNHVEMIGSMRGTAYHRFFELLDYSGDLSLDGIRSQITKSVNDGLLERNQGEVLNPVKYAEFIKSDVGQRMRAAYERGELWREQPFCIMVSGQEVNPDYPEHSEILIQGIIDVLFMEQGEYVIVDYKTDSVKNASELVDRYKVQLDYYAKAIEQITEKRVKEEIIYSVSLQEEIAL